MHHSCSKKENRKCFYCGKKGHMSRNCPKEKEESSKIKYVIGHMFENFISDNCVCPYCNSNLRCLNDKTPSCDILCDSCGQMFEVKSKCLSVKNIPSDIRINHGNYNAFKHRLEINNLNMFVVIYSFDRLTKYIKIRKIYMLDNNFLNDSNFTVITKKHSKNTVRTNIEFLNIPNEYNILNREITFEKTLSFD